MVPQSEIRNLLNNPKGDILSYCKKKAVGLSPWTAEDLLQESAARVLEELQQRNAVEFSSEQHFWAHVRTIIRNLARDLYRKKKPLSVSNDVIDCFPVPKDTFTIIDIAAANRVVELARERLKDKGARFVLDVFTEDKTMVELAGDAKVSRSTAERWFKRHFVDVARELRWAAVKVFGEDGVGEFISNASQVIKTGRKESKQLVKRIKEASGKEDEVMERGEDTVKMVRSRLVQVGELAYRNKLGRLSEIAQRIVFRIEAGEGLDDIVEAIARQYYHFGPSEHLTLDEIRAAKVEVTRRLLEIKIVFQLSCDEGHL